MDDADWRSALRLVNELEALELDLQSLILVTFAAPPGHDSVRGTFELAQTLSDLTAGPVVFVCHWPGFERSVDQFRTTEPETFPALLLQALSDGRPLDRSVYWARDQVMRRSNVQFEAMFGVPAYYATDSDVAPSPGPQSNQKVRTISSSQPDAVSPAEKMRDDR
jgi:hypothetical protein